MRSARQPFFAPDDVRDVHQVVVHDIGEVVSGHTVGFQQHLVVQFAALEHHVAANHILDVDALPRLHFQADDVWLASCDAALHFVRRKGQAVGQTAACQIVIGKILFGLTAGIQCFRRVKCNVGMAALHQLMGVFSINFLPVALAVWAIFSTKTHALVGQQTHPFQSLYDVIFRSRHIAVLVGVFYAEDKRAALLFGKQIIVQRRAYAANVQRAGGRRSKSNARSGHFV